MCTYMLHVSKMPSHVHAACGQDDDIISMLKKLLVGYVCSGKQKVCMKEVADRPAWPL